MNEWQTELVSAVRTSKITFESVELVSNEAHAQVVISVLNAFRKDAAGFVFAEPRTPDRLAQANAKPTDVLVLHPLLGCLLLEVKGWGIGAISDIEAGNFFLKIAGYVEARNPWHQAQEASSQIQNAARRVLQRRNLPKKDLPFFDCAVALPNVSRAEWAHQHFEASIAGSEILLKKRIWQTPPS